MTTEMHESATCPFVTISFPDKPDSSCSFIVCSEIRGRSHATSQFLATSDLDSSLGCCAWRLQATPMADLWAFLCLSVLCLAVLVDVAIARQPYWSLTSRAIGRYSIKRDALTTLLRRADVLLFWHLADIGTMQLSFGEEVLT